MTDSLQKYLMQSSSFFDTAHENFYHGMVLGMLAIMSDHYFITSNREAGEGRFDIQMEPRDRRQPGFIIEFKAGENLSAEELEREAKEALAQIRDRKYIEDLKHHGIRNIGMFGISFSGKQATSAYEQISI